MRRLLTGQRLREGLMTVGVLCCTLGLVRHPREVSQAVRDGLELCGEVILPALFPFFVLTSLVISLGLAGLVGRLLEPVMRPLFRLGGACAAPLALGLVGGYPVGARAALSLYQSGQCSDIEAQRLLAFCNNSGPAFILGVVGSGVFDSAKAGLLLWFTHAAASLCVGLIFRFYRGKPDHRQRANGQTAPISAVTLPAAFTKAVADGLSASLNLCAYVVCFTVILRLCVLSGLIPTLSGLLARLGIPELTATRLLTGLLELSAGVTSLRGAGPLGGRLALAAFLLGWAGISVHCQVLSFLAESGLGCRTYLLGKLLHGLISAGLTALLLRLIPLELTVTGLLTEQMEQIAGLELSAALGRSLAVSGILLLIFLLTGAFALKKAGKKGRSMI